MLSSLDWVMVFSLVIVSICIFIIISKFIYYFKNSRQIISDQRNNNQNIEILEVKLQEMKLKNKGYSLDENIKLIYDDEDIAFSMEWGNIIE